MSRTGGFALQGLLLVTFVRVHVERPAAVVPVDYVSLISFDCNVDFSRALLAHWSVVSSTRWSWQQHAPPCLLKLLFSSSELSYSRSVVVLGFSLFSHYEMRGYAVQSSPSFRKGALFSETISEHASISRCTRIAYRHRPRVEAVPVAPSR